MNFKFEYPNHRSLRQASAALLSVAVITGTGRTLVNICKVLFVSTESTSFYTPKTIPYKVIFRFDIELFPLVIFQYLGH